MVTACNCDAPSTCTPRAHKVVSCQGAPQSQKAEQADFTNLPDTATHLQDSSKPEDRDLCWRRSSRKESQTIFGKALIDPHLLLPLKKSRRTHQVSSSGLQSHPHSDAETRKERTPRCLKHFDDSDVGFCLSFRLMNLTDCSFFDPKISIFLLVRLKLLNSVVIIIDLTVPRRTGLDHHANSAISYRHPSRVHGNAYHCDRRAFGKLGADTPLVRWIAAISTARWEDCLYLVWSKKADSMN